MVLGKKAMWALGFAVALSSANGLAAPKKKGKKKAPAATEEGAATEEATSQGASTGGGSWAPKYGMAGCGLGSLVLKENTKMMQVFAATLNATGYQTIGITLGTSNCSAGAQASAANKVAQELFVANNLNALSKEAAQGEGQTLDAFASMLGCKGESVNQFAKLSRESYDAVYGNDNPTVVLDRMVEEVKADAELAASCNKA